MFLIFVVIFFNKRSLVHSRRPTHPHPTMRVNICACAVKSDLSYVRMPMYSYTPDTPLRTKGRGHALVNKTPFFLFRYLLVVPL